MGAVFPPESPVDKWGLMEQFLSEAIIFDGTRWSVRMEHCLSELRRLLGKISDLLETTQTLQMMDVKGKIAKL